jgi:hypothetical protein
MLNFLSFKAWEGYGVEKHEDFFDLDRTKVWVPDGKVLIKLFSWYIIRQLITQKISQNQSTKTEISIFPGFAKRRILQLEREGSRLPPLVV